MRLFIVEIDQEEDGRWIADVPAVPGATAYGTTIADAAATAIQLADWELRYPSAPAPAPVERPAPGCEQCQRPVVTSVYGPGDRVICVDCHRAPAAPAACCDKAAAGLACEHLGAELIAGIEKLRAEGEPAATAIGYALDRLDRAMRTARSEGTAAGGEALPSTHRCGSTLVHGSALDCEACPAPPTTPAPKENDHG